jgi:two-component system phosphate regulon sensor histidine kinase PhoR
MLWPILLFLTVLLLIGREFFWRKKQAYANEVSRQEMEKLKELQNQTAQQTQTQQEALFNSMVEGLLLLDQGGRITLANHAFSRLFGITTEVRGKTIMETVRLHELAELVEFLGAQKRVLGYEIKTADPTERWLQINGAAIFNPDNERHGTILVFHDLTRLKQLESARKDFVANVSHELRTPLSLIKGYVETLLDGAKDNPEVAAKFLRTIDRNSERLKLLIEDLLTISELESGRMKMNLQAVSLRPVIDKVFADLKARADGRRMILVDEASDLKVHADGNRLEQVLGNLVDNAIKYGREQGTVRVGARSVEQEQVEIVVQDDGPGIPAEALERVFERFYRIDKARSREQGGTGLGLSIVKHIVQSHGGRAWAKSELGNGAAFYFTLPLDSGSGQQPLL